MTLALQPISRPITSPSNLLRRRLCPASARLESRIPADDTGSEYSEEGRILHLHYADKALPRTHLSPKHQDLLEAADRMQEDTIRLVMVNAGIPSDAEFTEGTERPLLFQEGGRTIFPGTMDYWRYWPEQSVLLIDDAKFGFNEVTSADANLQLAAYAAMAVQEMPAANVYASVNQPRASFDNRRTMTVYTAEQFPRLREEIIRIVDASMQEDALLNAGEEQCRYCRAKEVCPAFRERITQIAEVHRESILSLPADQFLRVGQALRLAGQLKDAFNAEALRRIEAGELPDWSLKNNGAISKMADLQAAFKRFAEHYREHPNYLGQEGQLALDFMTCMDVRWGDLHTLVGKLEKCGEKKAKAIEAKLFGELIVKEDKAKSPVLPKE